MTAQPRTFDGIAGLVPRESAVYASLGVGLKRQALMAWRDDHPDYEIAPGMPPIVFKDNPARFFIKEARGHGEIGDPIWKRWRGMLPGFERFNLDENGDPAGKDTFYGFLPAGSLEWANPDAPEEDRRIKAPYFHRERKAQKLGRKDSSGNVQRTDSYRPPFGKEPPSHQPECRGDGVSATRWDYGRQEWDEIRCLNDDCPFSAVCPAAMQLMIHSREEYAGETALMRYESHAFNSTAHVEGFLTRLRRELDSMKLDGILYGLPVRMTVSVESKAAGVVRGKKLGARRFPVVKIGEQMSVVAFKEGLVRRLQVAGGSLALPPAPSVAMTPEEEAASAADFTVDPPGTPRLELLPVDHAANDAPEDIIEGEAVEESPPVPTPQSSGEEAPSDEPPAGRAPSIGEDGEKRLAAALKKLKARAVPKAFPAGVVAAVAETGIAGSTLPKDLTEDEAKAVVEKWNDRAKKMPRSK